MHPELIRWRIIRGRNREQKGQPSVNSTALVRGCSFGALIAPESQMMITRAPVRARGVLLGTFTSIWGVAGTTIRGI
jgi:hypothetical protein